MRSALRWASAVAGCWLVVLFTMHVPGAIAGEGPGESDEGDSHGTHFFGDAKNVRGLEPLDGVRVKIAIGGTMQFLVVLTDKDGRFRLEGFGRDVSAKSIAVSCEKAGYKTVEALFRHASGAKSAPIVIECLMVKDRG